MLNILARRREKARRAQSVVTLRRQFMDLQNEIQPDLFVEVGAYDGSTALEIRKMLPNARVVAFEANQANHEHFTKTLKHADSNVEYVYSAVADTCDDRTFRISHTTGTGLSKRSSLLDRATPKHPPMEVTVPCTTLDVFFGSAMPTRSTLWIDVEGASRYVLEGASNVLSTVQSLLIEVEEQRFWEGQWLKSDVLAYLERFGLVPVARDDEYPGQHNVLLRRLG